MLEILKSIVLGIIQGITEWLPISSTGHMIIFNSIFPLDERFYSSGPDFINLFLVLIQFGSMMAVVCLFFNKLNPFSKFKNDEQRALSLDLWKKVIVGSIPAVVVGLLFHKVIDKFFRGSLLVALMLIIYGVFFILVENSNMKFRVFSLSKLDYRMAFGIGLFQVLSLVPGTSRSGATILGALILGCIREVGAEFSFFLAIPTISGASLLETISYVKDSQVSFGLNEFVVLAVGCLTAFFVSLFVISVFMKFIKTHSFKIFAHYRIVIGIVILLLISSNVIKN